MVCFGRNPPYLAVFPCEREAGFYPPLPRSLGHEDLWLLRQR